MFGIHFESGTSLVPSGNKALQITDNVDFPSIRSSELNPSAFSVSMSFQWVKMYLKIIILRWKSSRTHCVNAGLSKEPSTCVLGLHVPLSTCYNHELVRSKCRHQLVSLVIVGIGLEKTWGMRMLTIAILPFILFLLKFAPQCMLILMRGQLKYRWASLFDRVLLLGIIGCLWWYVWYCNYSL